MLSDKSEISDDQIFDILSSARRRYVIYYLRNRNEEVSLTELSKQVAAWEYETEPDELTDQQQKRVYVSLYQTHVPKLADLGIVDYDRDRGAVALGKEAKKFTSRLDRNGGDETPWRLVYLTLAAVGVLTLFATIQDVAFFAAIDEATLGVVIVLLFGLVAAAQVLYQRYANGNTSNEF